MTAFDDLAERYDETFTDTPLGTALRRRVWAIVDPLVSTPCRVLELNCGTGEDAVHLARLGASVVATDVATEMLDATIAKAERHGVTGSVSVERLDLRDIEAYAETTSARFDLVLSNFGGMNCIEDLVGVSRALGRLTTPTGRVVLVIMGRFVPWEWGWFLAHRLPAKAFRRVRGHAAWLDMSIRYPTPGAVCRAFEPSFVTERTVPIGVVLPPSYAGEWLAARPRLLDLLDRLDRRASTVPGTAWLADHFAVVLRRT